MHAARWEERAAIVDYEQPTLVRQKRVKGNPAGTEANGGDDHVYGAFGNQSSAVPVRENSS